MDKLVQHIKMDMSGILKQGMYCYGEASLETNMEMQEPLEKLYNYENQPDMRKKVKEYIAELNAEYDRCIDQAESILAAIGDYEDKPMPSNYIKLVERAETLHDVKNDLESRLEELV